MIYKVAEKFKSIQGEGVYTGTPMAFIRFVGCSVGKSICQHCDTDFDRTYPWRLGGEFSEAELLDWAYPYTHICLTGGEPLDQDLRPLLYRGGLHFHIETSGTVEKPGWFPPMKDTITPAWVCVSPKPGFREEWIERADEVKVIVPGLGEINPTLASHMILEQIGSGAGPVTTRKVGLKHWPTLNDALRWADQGKIVFLQPRNAKFDVDKQNLLYVQDLLQDHPQLRLSVQMHKILKVQ